ncbi:MAG: hypothetical protein LQ341_001531 [Variospora aurantia]|nr:MAG: hypothetical protein LQ341_001531 [Variospora aurantia]
MLEGNWVSANLKFTTGDYTSYRDPEDYAQLEQALDTHVFPDTCALFKRKNRSLLMHGRPDCFSLLPVELRLMILCLLPSKCVDTIRQVSGGMAFVPLEGTFWLSRLSEPQYSHLPTRMIKQSGAQEPGQLPQWYLATQDEKLQDRNRLRIIHHNQMLVDKMLQRQEYLKGILECDTVSSGRYVPLVECLDEPHPAYEKSESTLTWRSEVFFDALRPFTVVESITPTYTSSYGGRYLTALVFGTTSEDLVLGYGTSKAGHSISISDRSSQRNNILMQSDSRGIFDVVTSKQNLQIMQLRKHGKIVLKPAALGAIAGLRAELTLIYTVDSFGGVDAALIVTTVPTTMSTNTADAGTSPPAVPHNLMPWSDIRAARTPSDSSPEGSETTLQNNLGQVHSKTCVICLEVQPAELLVHMPHCGHAYCPECLKKIFQNAMRSESLFPAWCCTQSIPIDKFEYLFTKEFMDGYRDREIEFTSPVRLYCHMRTCSQFIGHLAPAEGRKVTCPRCNSATCFDCKAPYHGGECPEDWSKNLVMAFAAKKGYQQCHECERLVERISGCKIIICFCNAQFCYLCGAKEAACECPDLDPFPYYSEE